MNGRYSDKQTIDVHLHPAVIRPSTLHSRKIVRVNTQPELHTHDTWQHIIALHVMIGTHIACGFTRFDRIWLCQLTLPSRLNHQIPPNPTHSHPQYRPPIPIPGPSPATTIDGAPCMSFCVLPAPPPALRHHPVLHPPAHPLQQ